MSSIYISESENEPPTTDVQGEDEGDDEGEDEVEEQELDSETPVELDSGMPVEQRGTYIYTYVAMLGQQSG